MGLLAAGHAAAAPRVGIRVVHLVDRSRVVHYRNGTVRPRTLLTTVRYPLAGRPPFPLVVFVHGFGVWPGEYAELLDRIVGGGFAVASPVFPGESPGAPGGPNESDLANEPADVRFVITRLLSGPLRALLDPRRIAVAGQSDGGIAALEAAYADGLRDPRIDAAIVMSGAQVPGPRFTYGPHRPPLLAVQGTADPINPPANTSAYFANARRPKFLLQLLGAGHLPPYTTATGDVTVVARVAVAFLDRYLRGAPLRPLLDAAPPTRARLVAAP